MPAIQHFSNSIFNIFFFQLTDDDDVDGCVIHDYILSYNPLIILAVSLFPMNELQLCCYSYSEYLLLNKYHQHHIDYDNHYITKNITITGHSRIIAVNINGHFATLKM